MSPSTAPHPLSFDRPRARPDRPAARPSLALRAACRAVVLAAGLAASTLAAAQTVRLATSAGDITISLDAAKAPRTVENFVAYVRSGHYDGTVFHRVIDGFMIQGGGFTADMNQKPTRPPIPIESRNGLKNERGTIAMARTGDPNSATSQFFINLKDNAFLDQPNSRDGFGYTVFGKVTAGMDVVDKIRAVATTTRGPHANVPVEPVVIRKATVEK
jgi:peptidyl-prolyl cis-trans isomerase A (cyclophilin A)